MNANTLKAITRHGESLLAAFPNAIEKNPVALCKKLRRIETSLTKPLTDYCNGTLQDDDNGTKLDAICDNARNRVVKILFNLDLVKHPHPICACGLFVNRDPRGCALKLDSEWTRNHNNSVKCNCHTIQTDMGGYGLIAPDLNSK
jgi:hypothetical protein